LGDVSEFKMNMNEIGKMSDKIWHEIPEHFPNAAMDQFIIMPNHFHGIIRILEENQNKDAARNWGLMNQTPTADQISDGWIIMKNPATTLGKIIRYYKAKSVLEIRNKINISFYWHRNYYEHVIRDGNELSRIRKYINENPTNWLLDEDNPVNRKRL
jgi:putative transposase